MRHVFATHDLSTAACGQPIDVDDLRGLVDESGVDNGMALVYSPHTTCAIVINELESGFLPTFAEALDELVPATRYYRHDDLAVRTQGIEDDTADFPNGHIRSLKYLGRHCTADAAPTHPLMGRSPHIGDAQPVKRWRQANEGSRDEREPR